MALAVDAARAVLRRLAAAIGLGLEQAALGILAIGNASMANAIGRRTVQKGIDPRGFALAAFGGAGLPHAVEVAQALAIREVPVPPYPGIAAAMGLLTTDLRYDAVRTCFQVSGALDPARSPARCRMRRSRASMNATAASTAMPSRRARSRS